jgi:hypothetical protein
LKYCAASREALKGKTGSVNVDTHDLLIEAMTLARLQRPVEARQRMEQASALIRERFPGAPDYLGKTWLDWVIYEILKKEATAVLRTEKAPGPG